MQYDKDKKPYDRNNSTRRTIRFEDALLELVEDAAGQGQFSAWVKDACRQRLERESIKLK